MQRASAAAVWPRARRRGWRRRALAGLAAALLAVGTGARAEGSTCGLEAGPIRTAVRVTDGETFVLDDGAEVRLVGAMSPRASDAAAEHASWPLEDQSRRELEAMILGKPAALAFAGRRSDRYGRLLAQVFVAGEGNPRWVQGHMLSHGMARAYSMPESTACMDELLSQERIAREARIGLWSEAVYQIRSGERVKELLRLRSTYQIVEGRVGSTSERRGRIFVNFGQDWRQDFTASLNAAAAKLSATSGLKAQELVGRRVRIRGWIERRGGPYVEVHDPHQIELLPAGSEAPREPKLPQPILRSRSTAKPSLLP